VTCVNYFIDDLWSNLLIYLIIFLALAMVLVPLMAFKPSKLVKRQMAFRDKALALGLQVKVADMPQSHRAKVRQQAVEHGVVYRLPFRRQKSLAVIDPQTCVFTGEGFEWSGTQPEFIQQHFEQCWAQLPPDSLALELNVTGVAVYWREQGTVERVQQLYEVLSSLSSSIFDYYGVTDGAT
jgi:hypothetical protein